MSYQLVSLYTSSTPYSRDCLFLHFRRIREKYETELKEVERSERNALEKFNSMKVSFYLVGNNDSAIC